MPKRKSKRSDHDELMSKVVFFSPPPQKEERNAPLTVKEKGREALRRNGGFSKVSEAVLQRAINAAMNATGLDVPSAAAKLSKLLREAHPQDTYHIYSRVLPVLSHYLRVAHPTGTRTLFEIFEREATAIHCMNILFESSLTRSSAQETFLLVEIDDVLRWMTSLFTRWVFDWPPPDSEGIDSDDIEMGETFAMMLRISIPHGLRRMLEYPAVRARIMEDECHQRQFGTLLAQMTIVQGREKDIDLLNRIKDTQAKESDDAIPPYASAFFEFLGQDSNASAHSVVSHLQHYVDKDNTLTFHIPQLSTLTKHLEFCTCWQGSDALLDACITQESLVITLMSLFLLCIEKLDTFARVRVWHAGGEALFAMIVSIIRILSRSFNRGGAPCISLALSEGLLKAIFSVDNMINALEMPVEKTQLGPLDAYLMDMVQSIMIHIVYPSVYHRAIHVFEFFNPVRAREDPPFHLTGFVLGLVRLTDRIREESTSLIGHDAEHPDDARAFRLLYKFCDNANCPNEGNTTKLGRCTTCCAGFYCSRPCQKIVWKEGHRQECKQLASSIEGRKKGLPSILTIHDRQYFSRTLPQRLHYHQTDSRSKSWISKTITDHVIQLDMRTFPITINLIYDPDRSARPGPLVMAKYPTGASFNEEGAVCISAIGTRP